MSAKKSWDIAPSARTRTTPAATPAAVRSSTSRSMRDMHAKPQAKVVSKPSVPVSTRNVTIARGKKTRPESKEPLKKRRKKTQKALGIVVGVATLLLLAAAMYVVWMPAFRVNEVTASGPHAESVEVLGQTTLYGTHAFILPRNSLFFIPENDLRARILEAYPDVEAVSIAPSGLNTLLLKTLPRAEAFVWCGYAPDSTDGSCYSANAEGLIFSQVSPESASTTEALRVYGPLEGQDGVSPIKARLGYASYIPEALRFVKALQTLGADVVSFSLRGDEADVRTNAGTRITYVLGREQEAAGIAASVFPQLALNDGSILYVDLRFSGKAYFKRAGAAAEEE